jgi:cobalt/nickel transport system permease protein
MMIHRSSDIRLKLLLVLFFIVSLLLIDIHQTGLLLILNGWLFVSAWFSKIDPGALLKKVVTLYPMILLVTILIPFSSPGSSATSGFLIFKINSTGLARFIEINIKCTMILICTGIFNLTTSPQQLLTGLQSMGLPQWILAILFLMQRYLLILKTELQRQVMAFRSRYIFLNPIQRLKYISRLLSIFVVRTFGRSERLYQAMLSRGFNGQIYLPQRQTWIVSDSLLLGINLIFFSGVFLFK